MSSGRGIFIDIKSGGQLRGADRGGYILKLGEFPDNFTTGCLHDRPLAYVDHLRAGPLFTEGPH
jgi:hypothetical protein